MKIIIIVAATIITGGILFSPTAKNIKGTWRVHNTPASCSDPIIRMRMDHGILKGTADLPSIGRYDVPIEKIQRTQDSVILEITPNEWIKVKWTNDSTMTGVLEKDKTKQEVRLSRQ